MSATEVKTIFKPKGFDLHFNCLINDKPTEFVFHRFTNKWILFITQLKRIGTVYEVEVTHKMQQLEPVLMTNGHKSVPYTITFKMGADGDMERVCIQQLLDYTPLHLCPSEMLISISAPGIDYKFMQAAIVALNKAFVELGDAFVLAAKAPQN